MAIGIPQILAIVTICLSVCIFTLEVHRARKADDVEAEDHVLAGALGYVVQKPRHFPFRIFIRFRQRKPDKSEFPKIFFIGLVEIKCV